MSRLILVRHCEPQHDARGLCYGTLDIGLSAAGHEHAARLAARLAEHSYDAVYASPRTRTVDTAVPIAAGRGLEPVIDDDLREIDFGELEGRSYDEIAQTDPDFYRAWMETPTQVRFPGGEGFGDVKRRALPALERIRVRHDSAVVVTHGGVVRAGVAAWLGMPDEAIFRLAQEYGGVTIVDWFGAAPLVRLMNG
jgi:alpha-ribazole phosphatase/probable phosphoglycerate mutase